MILDDLSTSLITVRIANLDQLCLDDLEQQIRIGQDTRKFFNLFQYLAVFLNYFILLQTCQTMQSKIQDRLRLHG